MVKKNDGETKKNKKNTHQAPTTLLCQKDGGMFFDNAKIRKLKIRQNEKLKNWKITKSKFLLKKKQASEISFFFLQISIFSIFSIFQQFKFQKNDFRKSENSEIPIARTVFDAYPLEGKSYYRLKIIQRNDLFEYSPVRVVNRVEKFFFKLYPNPTTDYIHLNYYLNSSEKDINADVVNMQGQIVRSIGLTGEEGHHEMIIDISEFPAGSYFIRIKKGTFVKELEVLKR